MDEPAGVWRALRWDGRLHALDQTLLPFREEWVVLSSADEVAGALRRLAIRGAPLIGIAAGYGVALEVARTDDWEPGVARLRAARPTAVNLAWAVDRVAAVARAAAGVVRMSAATPHSSAPPPAEAALAAAVALHAEEDAASTGQAWRGADWLEQRGARRLLTHCNSGALACGGMGSGLAVALELHRRHPGEVHVLCCETRPLLQGARLTTWELARAGVPHALCVDGAAAGLIARGEVDAVVTGTDRVAANGDIANKVGTYAHALAAAAAGILMVVSGPVSSIDATLASGAEIPVEERDAEEVRGFAGTEVAPPGTDVRNPAFDVTPAGLVSALVTERGVASPVDAAAIAALLS